MKMSKLRWPDARHSCDMQELSRPNEPEAVRIPKGGDLGKNLALMTLAVLDSGCDYG